MPNLFSAPDTRRFSSFGAQNLGAPSNCGKRCAHKSTIRLHGVCSRPKIWMRKLQLTEVRGWRMTVCKEELSRNFSMITLCISCSTAPDVQGVT